MKCTNCNQYARTQNCTVKNPTGLVQFMELCGTCRHDLENRGITVRINPL